MKKISILTGKPAMTGRIVNEQAKIKQELTKLAKEKKQLCEVLVKRLGGEIPVLLKL